MRNGIFPIYTKGRVLKKESIEYLRDFPYELASLAWENYCDGILFGFNISLEDKNIIVSRGALKYQGNITIVPENTIMLTKYEQILYIKLVIGDYRDTADYKTCLMEVKADRYEAQAENEIELGRFCLNPGAKLRGIYDSFIDLRTPENTLDLTHLSYAGQGTPTFHPRVLQEYARELMAFSTDPLDMSFALLCLNTNLVHKNSIQWYIAKKCNSLYEEYPLGALYEKLLQMLPQHELKEKAKKTRGRGPVIS
jgi:hypothetical protein